MKMNTKQLIVTWIAVVFLATLLVAYSVTAVFLFARVISAAVAILLLAGALIYSFSEHNNADNKRVAAVVAGVILLSGLVAAGFAYLQELREEQERLGRIQELQERFKEHRDEWRFADPRYKNRVARDSLELTEISTLATRSPKCDKQSARDRSVGVQSSCLHVSGVVTNYSGWTVSRIWLFVTIDDTLGNVIENGTAILERTIAPGESEKFAVTTNASADSDTNRTPRITITRADFVLNSER